MELAVLRDEQGKILKSEAHEPSDKNTTGAKVKKGMRLIVTLEIQIFTIGFCDDLNWRILWKKNGREWGKSGSKRVCTEVELHKTYFA